MRVSKPDFSRLARTSLSRIVVQRRLVVVEKRALRQEPIPQAQAVAEDSPRPVVVQHPLAAEVGELLRDGPIRWPVELR